METTTYTALCERAGRWWTIRVPQVDGLTAQVKSLEQAEMMTRQTIARALGIPAESIAVEVVPEAPAPVTQALQARHTARLALEAAVQATLAALDALAKEGYQFPDAAAMLGLSPSEIAQYAPDGSMGVPPSPISGPIQMAAQ
jgi:predicted RNase H-like HicB family nuclease